MSTSTVYNIDCIEYMKSCDDNMFDLAIVDPPYGGKTDKHRNTCGRFRKFRRDDADSVRIDWDVAPSDEYFSELFRISRNQVIWGGNNFTLPPTRCFIVWVKTGISENFTFPMCEYAWTSFDLNAKVFYRRPQGTKADPRIHPAQKPVELYEWILERFAVKGDSVFDSHMGSQSSRIAAERLGFDYTGCEIDTLYFAEGCARFDRVTSQRTIGI